MRRVTAGQRAESVISRRGDVGGRGSEKKKKKKKKRQQDKYGQRKTYKTAALPLCT